MTQEKEEILKIFKELSEENKKIVLLAYRDIVAGKELKTQAEYLKELRAGE